MLQHCNRNKCSPWHYWRGRCCHWQWQFIRVEWSQDLKIGVNFLMQMVRCAKTTYLSIEQSSEKNSCLQVSDVQELVQVLYIDACSCTARDLSKPEADNSQTKIGVTNDALLTIQHPSWHYKIYLARNHASFWSLRRILLGRKEFSK